MNANENPCASDPRLKRIKYMSRFLKGLMFGYLLAISILITCGTVMTEPGSLPAWPSTSMERLYQGLFYSLTLLAFIAFYRLLSFYEQGRIFSAGNSSQIRRLGWLSMAFALLHACSPIFLPLNGVFTVLAASLNFFLSPWFFLGCFIIIVTWIMDEGRKMQEEQSLTV